MLQDPSTRAVAWTVNTLNTPGHVLLAEKLWITNDSCDLHAKRTLKCTSWPCLALGCYPRTPVLTNDRVVLYKHVHKPPGHRVLLAEKRADPERLL
jgi:hypothetical protein